MAKCISKRDFKHIKRKQQEDEATAVFGLGAYLIILIVLIGFIGV